MNLSTTLRCIGLCAALALAAPAAGQGTYHLTGGIVSRGQLQSAAVPMTGVGGPFTCPSIFGYATQSATPAPYTATNLSLLNAAPAGCVTGGPTLIPNGDEFSVPANFFSRPAPGNAILGTLPNVPSLLQFATSISVMGPAAPAQFRYEAWSTQTGRAGPNFTWCPEDISNCTAPSSGVQPMLVKYRAGPHRFGGTMQLIQGEGPEQSSLAIALPGGAIRFDLFSGVGPRAVGGSYANSVMDSMRSGQLWAMYTYTPMGGLQPSTYVGPVPVLPRTQIGFPFTTGTVIARRTGMTGQGNQSVITLTAMGGSSLGSSGRFVSLVAGGLALDNAEANRPLLTLMRLPEPRRLPGWAASLALLALLGGARRATPACGCPPSRE